MASAHISLREGRHGSTPSISISSGRRRRTTMNQMMKMMRPVLEDRFQLKIHRETRVIKEYALLLTKGGPKMKQAAETGVCCSFGKGLIRSTHMDMHYLAGYLAGALGCPVADETGLNGFYEFVLKYNEDYASAQDATEIAATPDPANAPIFTAIQEQLGLKLETRKGPADVIVIDSAARPSSN
jgi:uncharacterized protein (TIGR03435 family)